jgi:hypothetical protein
MSFKTTGEQRDEVSRVASWHRDCDSWESMRLLESFFQHIAAATVFASAAMMLAGCGEAEDASLGPSANSGDCNYLGESQADGTSWVDDCGTCSCTDGEWSCTEDLCACELDGHSVPHSYEIADPQSCSTCSCDDGSLDCADADCGRPCEYEGELYPDGWFVDSGGCARPCRDGVVGTPGIVCEPAPNACIVDGVIYDHESTFQEHRSCNNCTCDNGGIGCTKIYCPSCWFESRRYVEGATFISAAGQNCTCDVDEVSCE